MSCTAPFLRWSEVLRQKYGTRVHKISLDLGASCPHRRSLTEGGCIFCDARGGGSGAALRGESVEAQILRGIHGIRTRFNAERAILYFQSYTTTHLPFSLLDSDVRRALAIARQHIPVVGISVGTRPDTLPPYILSWLQSLTADGLELWVELGVQTTDPQGLSWLRRGHGLEAVIDALTRLKSFPDLHPVAHLIAGIPGEAEDQLTQSLLWLVERGVLDFKFHPLHVLRDTPLEELYQTGSFGPISRERYVHLLRNALEASPARVTVHRLSADATPPALVAPLWVGEKGTVEKAIREIWPPASREKTSAALREKANTPMDHPHRMQDK